MKLPRLPAGESAPRVVVLWTLLGGLLLLGAWRVWVLANFQPLGLDFLPLWTAGRLAWTDPARIYDFGFITRAQGWLLPGLKWPRPYAYPPSALLLLAPLGRLPFWVALGAWLALGLGLFVYAGRRLAQQRRGLALGLMLLAPCVMIAVQVGQSVLLVAGLIVIAVLELARRPRLAGVLLALAAAIKPQAVLLAPVALIAAGAYEALAYAALTAIAVVTLSIAVFGVARWSEWIGALPAFQQVIEATPAIAVGVITPTGLAHQLGLAGPVAALWRIGFALCGVAIVWRAFSRPSGVSLRLTALMGGGLLVAPYAMPYDASLLAPGVVAPAVERLSGPGWFARLLALVTACEIAAPRVGSLAVLAVIVLSWLAALSPRKPLAEAAALEGA